MPQPLRSTSESMATKLQGHVKIHGPLSLEHMGMSLVGAASWDHMDVQGLCVTGPTTHWMWHFVELAPFLTSSYT